MTRREFLSLDWNDAHVGYDIQVGNQHRTVAYMTVSSRYPKCLCLVADNKDFPIRNTGCGIMNNLCPKNVIDFLEKERAIEKVVAVIDGVVYGLVPGVVHINGIDSEVLFDIVPFREDS